MAYQQLVNLLELRLPNFSVLLQPLVDLTHLVDIQQVVYLVSTLLLRNDLAFGKYP